MCASVICDGVMCETQNQLTAAVGGELVLSYGNPMGSCCLCPVDVLATAEKHGYAAKWSDDPFVEYELHALSAQEEQNED